MRVFESDDGFVFESLGGESRFSSAECAYRALYIDAVADGFCPSDIRALFSIFFGYCCYRFERGEISKATFAVHRSGFNGVNKRDHFLSLSVDGVTASDVHWMGFSSTVRAFIKRAYTFAYSVGLIAKNPMKKFKLHKNKKAKAPSWEVVYRLTEHARANDKRLFFLVTLASNCGLIISELLGLRWSDFGVNSVRVSRYKDHSGNFVSYREDDARFRTVRISQSVLESSMIAYSNDHEKGASGDDLVFGFSDTRATDLLSVACVDLGVKRLTFGALRHYAAVEMIKNKYKKNRDIVKCLGYKNASSFYRIYADYF